MKVNKLQETWTENLGGCVPLEAEGHVVAVQVPPQPNVLFTILHESVHVWQAIMQYMGEDNPGIETEAYTIEHIAKQLMLEYQRLTGEQLAVHDQRKTRLQKGKQAVQQPS
jgi:hypothetical protein